MTMERGAVESIAPPDEPSDPETDRPVRRLIIAIDGPAGTGKSTVARQLARRLGLEFLDTGAMYRAAAAIAIDAQVNLNNAEEIVRRTSEADLHFDWTTDPPTLRAFGKSIMHRLRDADVSAAVSPVSGLAALRRLMVETQRRIGEAHPRLVSEGRDQGSVVFHDADVKFFLHASPRVRAERRAEQLRSLGRAADVDKIERELIERDERDSTRPVGPLVCPPDAMRIDTSTMSETEVVGHLESLVRGHLGEGSGSGAATP